MVFLGPRRSVFVLVLVLFMGASDQRAVVAGSTPGLLRPDPASLHTVQEAEAPLPMLGFRVGEERRYALGPPDALRQGEAAAWGITLHHLEGEAPVLRAVFDLEYTRREPFGPLRESRTTRSVWAELTVNEAGFPLKIVVGERIEAGEIITEYVYAGGRYGKSVHWPENEFSIDLRIPGHDGDDELRGVEEVEIGGETVLARRFEIEGPFRSGYLDALGRVLLLQHDPGSGMERPQHIRMLRPNEY